MEFREARESGDALPQEARLKRSLQGAFDRSADLRPPADFAMRMRTHIRRAAAQQPLRRPRSSQWLALAASVLLATGVTGLVLVNRSARSSDALANDAIGDHQNCALKFRLVRAPIPLEDAAQQFDASYRLLLTAPSDETATPGGAVTVVERHSCAFEGRRFGHVVLRYHGRVVSLLVTRNDRNAGLIPTDGWIPHLIGRSESGLSVVSVRGQERSVMLVSDLAEDELTELSNVISVPLARQLQTATSAPDPGDLALLALPATCRRPSS